MYLCMPQETLKTNMCIDSWLGEALIILPHNYGVVYVVTYLHVTRSFPHSKGLVKTLYIHKTYDIHEKLLQKS